MLYKIKPTDGVSILVPLKPTSLAAQKLTEKAMEEWLAANPHVVVPGDERLLVVHQEKAFQNLTDILAVDAEGNLVVIEVKRGQTPRDVIAQALEYASDVESWDYSRLNSLAVAYFAERGVEYDSLLSAYLNVFAVDAGEFVETEFNRRQRVLIVGEAIEPKIERTARWLLRRGIEISCVSYQCYSTDDSELFLDFTEVVRPGEEPAPTPSPGASNTPLGIEDAVKKMSPTAKALFTALRDRATAFGPDVQVGVTASYVKFTTGNNFAEIMTKKYGLLIYIRPEGLSVDPGGHVDKHGLEITRAPESSVWTLSCWFKLTTMADLDGAELLMRGSYEAVSKVGG